MTFGTIDQKMVEDSIIVMKGAYNILRNSTIKDAKVEFKDLDKADQEKYGRSDKKDTKGFDIIAEKAIVTEYKGFAGIRPRISNINKESAVVITEERGKVGDNIITGKIPVFITDPVDMSSQLESLLKEYSSSAKNLGDIFDKAKTMMGDKLRYDSCNSSLTLLKDNTIKYSLILNLFSGELFVAYPEGVYSQNIDKVERLEDINNKVNFRTGDSVNTIFYNSGDAYNANRKGTALKHLNLIEGIAKPGGPNRFAYLIAEEYAEGRSPAGIIAYNGEKIQESLPSIATAFFSGGQLEGYKLYPLRDNHATRSNKRMTPPHESSLYKKGLMQDEGINLDFLNHYDHPSDFRDSIVIVPKDNDLARFALKGMVDVGLAVQIIGEKQY